MYKYTFTGPGCINIKTPTAKNVKTNIKQFADHIENHSEYDNGLILDIFEYPNKFEYISNKKLIVLDDFSIAFEE